MKKLLNPLSLYALHVLETSFKPRQCTSNNSAAFQY